VLKKFFYLLFFNLIFLFYHGHEGLLWRGTEETEL
jgi:hypothetical protein